MQAVRRHLAHAALATAGLVTITAIYGVWLPATTATTIALTYLLLVLLIAAIASRAIAVATSLAAALAIDFFFLPPLYRFTVDDPQNWVDLLAFLGVSLVASHLSTMARARQRDAQARRDELGRLFEISRDILREADSADAIPLLAHQIARRFQLGYAAICLPVEGSFTRYEVGRPDLGATIADDDLRLTMDQAERPAINHSVGHVVGLTLLRRDERAVGVLALAGTLEPRTRDVLIGLVEMALERIHFIGEREQTQLAQRSAELKSNLLASLAHDLGTPLTAVRVGVTNICAPSVTDSARAEQGHVVLAEMDHLNQLFQNIFEMTRIDAGAIAPQPQWVYPAEIVEAAMEQVRRALRFHEVTVTDRAGEQLVQVDPRLTAYALGRLLENAAQYSPEGSTISVIDDVTPEGLLLLVRDRGAGIAPADFPHLFDRFYRGASGVEHRTGTGMGLAIARGLLAAEAGHVWAENAPEGGAQFSILVPAAPWSLRSYLEAIRSS
jgi:two-component system sensor histidine kinase KdpD